MKKINETKDNEKILADVVAIKIKENLKSKKNFAQDLIDGV